MLDRTHDQVKALVDTFAGHRSRLRDTLLEACAAAPPRAGCEEFISSGTVRPRAPKRLFQVTDGRTARKVRNELMALKALLPRIAEACRQAALDQGHDPAPLDLGKERGLWLPEVIDAERGDCQVNVMVYPNRAIRVLPAAAAVAMVGAEGADDPARLKMEAIARAHPTVRLCRDAGNAYRLLVRGKNRRTELVRGGAPVSDNYEIHNLREFAIVLGAEVKINFPVNLPNGQRRRKPRKDALDLGTPLHTFRGAVDRNLWAVYPAGHEVGP